MAMMKPHCILLLIVVLVTATGCPPSTSPRSGEHSTSTDNTGAILHAPSQIAFPPSVHSFVRGEGHSYNPDGSDVSMAYNNVGLGVAIAATTYIYPSPRIVSIASPQSIIDTARHKLSKDEFARCKADIVGAHPGAKLISEGPFKLGDSLPGLMAEYEYSQSFAGAVQMVRSRLYLTTYVHGSWTVKHRITFPAGKAFQPECDDFVRDFGALK
jgi:hypothetical protein